MSDDIGDDDPIPLAKACKIFLHGHLTKSALRREHARGNLDIIRIANKDFVTRNDVRRMIEKCTLRASEETDRTASRPADRPNGITASEALKGMLAQYRRDRSAEAATGSPRAAAKARLKQLRDSLPATNPNPGRRRGGKKVNKHDD